MFFLALHFAWKLWLFDLWSWAPERPRVAFFFFFRFPLLGVHSTSVFAAFSCLAPFFPPVASLREPGLGGVQGLHGWRLGWALWQGISWVLFIFFKKAFALLNNLWGTIEFPRLLFRQILVVSFIDEGHWRGPCFGEEMFGCFRSLFVRQVSPLNFNLPSH